MNNKRFIRLIIIILSIVLISLSAHKLYSAFNTVSISKITLENFDEKQNKATIKIKINEKNQFYSCFAKGKKEKYTSSSVNNECTLSINVKDTYKIYLEENGNKSKEYNLADYIPNILSFNFKEQIIYLTKDETTPLEYTDVTFKQEDYNFKIKNPDIAKYEDGKIIALKEGKTYLYSDKIDQELAIVVTNLLTKPYATKEKKKLLTCHAYTEEESKLLDTILEYKVNKAGYQTRAGALAAARFLTLEFAYRVPYFYENGRVPISSTNKSNINTHIADGEGRYYKKGLYLSDSKKKQIIKSYKGPAIWGCNLMNFETREEWGYYSGQLRPNGLDCSGFVTWALKQAGFEPGDVGAGEDPGRDGQCTDLGKFVTLSDNINNIKAGDLLNWWGHIAMLIGIDNDTYYVAESLSYIGGVRAMIYTKQELLSTFKYAVLMDDYYKKEGLYTKMW